MKKHIFQHIFSTLNAVPALGRYLQKQWSPGESSAIIQQLLRQREKRFVWMLEHVVYGHPGSPYQQMLRHAGCELEDIKELVSINGLEKTLRHLSQMGIFVSHDEMKGRKPIRRGSADFHFREEDFDNPLLKAHFKGVTSGSTGKPTKVRINFAHSGCPWHDLGYTTRLRDIRSFAKMTTDRYRINGIVKEWRLVPTISPCSPSLTGRPFLRTSTINPSSQVWSSPVSLHSQASRLNS